MLGRKILTGFCIVGLLVGLSCSLNPQPEPPGTFSNDQSGNPATGGGVPAVSQDGGVGGPGAIDIAEGGEREAGAEGQDSSIASDGSMADGGSVDAASDATGAEAESSADAGADVTEEGATTAD
jgi:hypothetical protein